MELHRKGSAINGAAPSSFSFNSFKLHKVLNAMSFPEIQTMASNCNKTVFLGSPIIVIHSADNPGRCRTVVLWPIVHHDALQHLHSLPTICPPGCTQNCDASDHRCTARVCSQINSHLTVHFVQQTLCSIFCCTCRAELQNFRF